MAGRHATILPGMGPVLEQDPLAPPAYSPGELQAIRVARMEADVTRAAEPAWPEQRRFATLYPGKLVRSGAGGAITSRSTPVE
jgi:hypothetical protein